jgi:outer membrane protein assembly factor BamB
MINIFSAILFCTLILTSCEEKKWTYNPAVPYPTLSPGDFWPDKFDQRGLQNAIIYKDKIYCNTIDVGSDSNFLYCLNPKDGHVMWRANVAAYATQPVSYYKDTIIYCSYLGDMYAFNNNGKKIWENKYDRPYSGHSIDTTNSTLLVKTVSYSEVSAYSFSSGKIVSKIESDSLKNLIEKYRNNIFHFKNEYRFVNKGKEYGIQAKSNEMGKYKIEIINYGYQM